MPRLALLAVISIGDVAAVAGAVALVPAGEAGVLHAVIVAVLFLQTERRAYLSARALHDVPEVTACSTTALIGPAVLALFSVIPGAVLAQAAVTVPFVVAARAAVYAGLRAWGRRHRLLHAI